MALCPSLLLSAFYMELRADFIHSKNQVTNMDDVCKLFDFVVLRAVSYTHLTLPTIYSV